MDRVQRLLQNVAFSILHPQSDLGLNIHGQGDSCGKIRPRDPIGDAISHGFVRLCPAEDELHLTVSAIGFQRGFQQHIGGLRLKIGTLHPPVKGIDRKSVV